MIRKAYNATQAAALDVAAQAAGVSGFELMLRAGEAAFAQLCEQWPKVHTLLVVAGKGNNGGDAYVVAGLAATAGWRVKLWQALGTAVELKGSAAQARDWAAKRGVIPATPATGELQAALAQADPRTAAIVDGLLGTGARLKLQGSLQQLVAAINTCPVPVLALDLPSGLDASTGAELGVAIRADLTLTFIGIKIGLLTGAGPDLAGRLLLDSLGVSDRVLAHVPGTPIYAKPSAQLRHHSQLQQRRRAAYKNEFGHVLAIGGDHGGGGAIILAAEAALRVGVGLVSVATRAAHVAPLLVRRPEVMAQGVRGAADIAARSARASVLLIGPGLGQSPWSEQLLDAAIVAARDADKPLIVDADALNLIARDHLKLPNKVVMTPHPGEAARLLGCDTSAIAADRVGALIELAECYQAIVVLKGVGSIIADPAGLIGVCSLGNPGMASAGMGDVLAGLTAGLIAQLDCTATTLATAVAIHAAAGDLAARQLGQLSLLASDLLAAIPEVMSAPRSVAGPERGEW